MKTIRLILTAVLACLGCSVVPCHAEQAALQPVEFQQIKLGGFWKQQAQRLTEKWLPHCIRQMEAGGAGQELLNLVNTAKVLRGESPGKYTGAPWSDAYVYNTIEAICLALAVDPAGDAELIQAQAALRAKIEQWIPIILAAQLPDGYIHSFHTVNNHPHFSNIGWHEFYVMGYLLEMGVAHYRLTGGQDRRLYEAAVKCADHLYATFGSPPKRSWKNGHPGLELALCRLARLVNEVQGAGAGDKYFQLAKHFLDHQHEIQPNPYDQSNLPAVELTNAEGHAVARDLFLHRPDGHGLVAGRRGLPQRRGQDLGQCDPPQALPDRRRRRIAPRRGVCQRLRSAERRLLRVLRRLRAELLVRSDAPAPPGCPLPRCARARAVQQPLGLRRIDRPELLLSESARLRQASLSLARLPVLRGQHPAGADRDQGLDVLDQCRPGTPCTSATSSTAKGPFRISRAGRWAFARKRNIRGRAKCRSRCSRPPRPPFTLNIRIPNRTESELYAAAPDLADKFAVSVNGERQSLPVGEGIRQHPAHVESG